MKILEIKNNLYQPVSLILKDGTQMNIPKREKRQIKESDVVLAQVQSLKKKEKIKVKELNK